MILSMDNIIIQLDVNQTAMIHTAILAMGT